MARHRDPDLFDDSTEPGTTAEPRVGGPAWSDQIPRPRQSSDAPGRVTPSAAAMTENRLRGRLVDRLTLMADRHRRHAEEQQGTRHAVGRHALAFFYSDDAASGKTEVVAGTRLFFDSPETEDLVPLLDTMIERAGEHPTGLFNPVIHMCNRVEPIAYSAQLLGVGVTTVCAPEDGSEAYASLGMNRPYTAVARMEDGTDILLRSESGFLARVEVRSTQTLNVNGRHTRHWEWLTAAQLQDPDTLLPDILERLAVLLDLATGRATTSGGPTDTDGPLRLAERRGPSARRRTVRLSSRGSRR